VTNLVTGLPAPVAPTNSPEINARSLAEESSESQGADEPAPPQMPSSSGTPTETPEATTLPDPGPTLGKVTEDGNKATPTTSNPTTAPKKNVFTELADTVKGFFSPKTKPAPSTPTSDPTGTTPSGQSEGPTSNAA
jgi:hypothetical protein